MTGYVLLFRDEQGNVQYFNKLFSSEAEAFEFVKLHRIHDYEIVTQEELQQFVQEQQLQLQQYEEQTQQQYQQPRHQMGYKSNRGFHPAFVQNRTFHPVFIGRKRR